MEIIWTVFQQKKKREDFLVTHRLTDMHTLVSKNEYKALLTKVAKNANRNVNYC